MIVMALTLHALSYAADEVHFLWKVTGKTAPVINGCGLSPVGPAAHAISGTQ